MNTQASPATVTRELVPEDQRLVVVERLFGMAFPLQLEPVIYGITDMMAEGYDGGFGTSTRCPTKAFTWHPTRIASST